MVTPDSWYGINQLRAVPFEGNTQRTNPVTGAPVVHVPPYPRLTSVPPLSETNPLMQRPVEVVSAAPPIVVSAKGNIGRQYLVQFENGIRLQDPINADILMSYLDVEFKFTNCPIRTRNFWALGATPTVGIPSNWVELALREFVDYWVSANPYALISALLNGHYERDAPVPPEYARNVISEWKPEEFASMFLQMSRTSYFQFVKEPDNPFVAGWVEYYANPAEEAGDVWTAYVTGAITLRFKVGTGGLDFIKIEPQGTAGGRRHSAYVPPPAREEIPLPDYVGPDPLRAPLPAEFEMTPTQFRSAVLSVFREDNPNFVPEFQVQTRAVGSAGNIVGSATETLAFGHNPTKALWDKIFRIVESSESTMPGGQYNVRRFGFWQPDYTNMIDWLCHQAFFYGSSDKDFRIYQYALQWYGFSDEEIGTIFGEGTMRERAQRARTYVGNLPITGEQWGDGSSALPSGGVREYNDWVTLFPAA